MRSTLGFAIALFAALISSFSLAATQENWSGAWNGTIGRTPITVCRNGDFMVYFYNRYLRAIYLNKTSDNFHWDEVVNDEITGRWAVVKVENDKISGRWSKPDGTGSLPIQLERRVDVIDSEHPCGDERLYAPLKTVKPRIETQVKTFNNKRYSVVKVSIPGEPDYQANLFSPIDGAAHFSEALPALEQQFYFSEQRQYGLMHECRLSSWQADRQGRYSYTFNPIFWSSRWLILNIEWQQICGNVPAAVMYHPQFVVDMANGKLVDKQNWFPYEDDALMITKHLAPNIAKFLKTLAPGAQPGQYCQKFYENAYVDYDFLPVNEGMQIWSIFSDYRGETPDKDCGESFIVPYNSLIPYATTEGKEVFRSLQHGD